MSEQTEPIEQAIGFIGRPGTRPSDDWLECDGQEYRAIEYPALYCTLRRPDLTPDQVVAPRYTYQTFRVPNHGSGTGHFIRAR